MSKQPDIDLTKAEHLADILLGRRYDPLKSPIYTPMYVKPPKIDLDELSEEELKSYADMLESNDVDRSRDG